MWSPSWSRSLLYRCLNHNTVTQFEECEPHPSYILPPPPLSLTLPPCMDLTHKYYPYLHSHSVSAPPFSISLPPHYLCLCLPLSCIYFLYIIEMVFVVVVGGGGVAYPLPSPLHPLWGVRPRETWRGVSNYTAINLLCIAFSVIFGVQVQYQYHSFANMNIGNKRINYCYPIPLTDKTAEWY